MKDLYQVLNLSPNVYQDKIKRKFRELAKKYHPDKWSGDDSLFREIKNAYDILSDVEKRKIYDQVTRFEEVDNIFNEVLNITIPLSINNILLHKPVKISYRRSNICSCEGKKYDCEYCEGTGIMYEDVDMTFRDTHIYYNKMEFVIDSAGNVNKYGETQRVKGIIIYEYDLNKWKFVSSVDDVLGYFVYDVQISDDDFKKSFDDLNFLPIYIDNIGEIIVEKGSISNGNLVNTYHPRLKIRLNVFVKELSKLL